MPTSGPATSAETPIAARVFSHKDLVSADLVVDALYKGGSRGNAGDDPIHRLCAVGNQGGFRFRRGDDGFVRLCVLYTSMADPNWPDALQAETGRFVYYGDNKRPGHELHDTPRGGNQILRQIYSYLHEGRRDAIPPILVFSKAGTGRDVVFRGLAAPGADGVASTEDLVAIWRTAAGARFQNYRAIFTVLDAPVVSRQWLAEIKRGDYSGSSAPRAWTDWVAAGKYKPLTAPRNLETRKPSEQLRMTKERQSLLERIVSYFDVHAQGKYAFEHCAAALVKMMDPNVASVDVTRPWRDGGRDATGKYLIGPGSTGIVVEFALEAKCKRPSAGNCCGVRDTSRLISRLRYRQFGIFLTTSCVNSQAYSEILEDGHPVLILSGADIMDILWRNGIDNMASLERWLRESSPELSDT